MKNFIYLVISLLLSVPSLNSQTGKVFDALTLKSSILDSERKYAIYLPPDYETSQRSYPVLYLLHGAGDDHTGWVQFGEVSHITDQAIANGSATPMIIVMPDADTGKRGYFNTPDGKWNYEDFFFHELIPHIEATFRAKATKRYRAVAGLSMGGGGTFMYALHHPEMFSSACPLSAYVGPLSMEQFQERLDQRNESYDPNTIQEYYNQHNAISLINNVKEDDLKAVRWYIDCGDDDFLFEGNSLAHIAMTKKKVPHEYRVRDGRHSWTYWRASLPKVLSFVSDAFHQF